MWKRRKRAEAAEANVEAEASGSDGNKYGSAGTSVEAMEVGETLEREEAEKHLRKRLWEAGKEASVEATENIDRRDRKEGAVSPQKAGRGASVEEAKAIGQDTWRQMR